jgi:hypothetical protein
MIEILRDGRGCPVGEYVTFIKNLKLWATVL